MTETETTTEWEKDGDPCNDCKQPSNYSEATGWYYHMDPAAPECFLMGSGPPDPSEFRSEFRRDEFLRRADGSIYGRRSRG